MAEKLSSPVPASGSPAGGLPQQARPPIQLPVPPPEPQKRPPQAKAIVPLPVTPPPEPKKKLISPNPVVPFQEERPSQKRLTIPKASSPAVARKLIAPDEGKFRRVAAIKEISNTIWRDELLPAHFDGCMFHVESGAREGGRRIVVHEFPKRDIPYSEDMGRSATTFTVRGYCIVYPTDFRDFANPLYMRDYRVARNILQDRLDKSGPGTLQLPTYRPVKCVCQRYRMTEEQKLGGYVVFDMQFVELGAPPFRPIEDTEEKMLAESRFLQQRVLEKLARPHTAASALPRPVLPTAPAGSPPGLPTPQLLTDRRNVQARRNRSEADR